MSKGQPVRRTLVAALATLAVAVGMAAVAWACSPQGSSISLHGTNGDSGPVGSTVTIHGTSFDATKGPIDITFNGTQVATATTSPFTTTFTVPNVPDGSYFVVASGTGTNGSPKTAAARFLVGSPPAPQQPSTPAPTTGNPEDEASPVDTTSSGSDAASRRVSGESRSGSTSAITSGGDSTSAGGTGTSVSGGRGVSEGAVKSGDSGGVVRTGSGQAVFADSLGVNGPKGVGPAAPRSQSVSERSAGGDLWGGFASDDKRATADLAAATGPSEGPGAGLGLSMALGVLGLLTLAAGAGATQLRRRRAVARSH